MLSLTILQYFTIRDHAYLHDSLQVQHYGLDLGKYEHMTKSVEIKRKEISHYDKMNKAMKDAHKILIDSGISKPSLQQIKELTLKIMAGEWKT